jgi:hypothetical protein
MLKKLGRAPMLAIFLGAFVAMLGAGSAPPNVCAAPDLQGPCNTGNAGKIAMPGTYRGGFLIGQKTNTTSGLSHQNEYNGDLLIVIAPSYSVNGNLILNLKSAGSQPTPLGPLTTSGTGYGKADLNGTVLALGSTFQAKGNETLSETSNVPLVGSKTTTTQIPIDTSFSVDKVACTSISGKVSSTVAADTRAALEASGSSVDRTDMVWQAKMDAPAPDLEQRVDEAIANGNSLVMHFGIIRGWLALAKEVDGSSLEQPAKDCLKGKLFSAVQSMLAKMVQRAVAAQDLKSVLQILRDMEVSGINGDCPEIQAGLSQALKLAIQELKDQTKTGDVPFILQALTVAVELGLPTDSPEAQAAWAAVQATLSAALDAAIKAGDVELVAYIAAEAYKYGFSDLAQKGANYAGIKIP